MPVNGFGSRIRRRLRRSSTTPRLSVVIPVYNVEEYLRECLDSLLGQSFTDFEAVLVDDGSTDGSAALAQRYVRMDPRLRLVRQPNAGLSAARNAGVRAAHGEYLTFLDADDRLPPDAYATMMGTIERTGSDMVIGKLKRDDGKKQVAMRLMHENHRRRREEITVEDLPLILADVFAVNKIFRRSFWDEAGLEFPVDLRYEDQPTLTRALLTAKKIDVIPETVYFWRIRRDRSSITQQRDDVADLTDRIITKRMSTEALGEAEDRVRDVWFGVVLPVDMWEYFRLAPGASERYWELLRSALDEFWNEHTMPFELTSVPVQQRLMGWLVQHDRREELAEVVAFLEDCGGDIPLDVREDQVVALLPGVGEHSSGLHKHVYTLAPHEMGWETRIIAAEWAGAGQLRLDGFALIRNVPTARVETSLTANLVGPAADGFGFATAIVGEVRTIRHVVLDVPITPVWQPRASRFVGRPSQDYDDCGFTCTIDVAALAAEHPGTSTWRLVLERRVAGLRGAGIVTSFDRRNVDQAWHELPVTDGVPVKARVRELPGEELILELQTGWEVQHR